VELVDFETYARNPFGHATAGDGWIRFYPSPALAGFVIWGELGEIDMAALVRALEVPMEPEMHVTLADVQAVRGGDPRAFRLLQEYTRRASAMLGLKVRRMAIVRPHGLLGAAAAGFFGIERAPCPVEVFDDRTRALDWLGVETSFSELLDAQIGLVSGTAPFLRELRVILDAKPTLASADEIARAVAVSTRTLQRRLRELETTLSREIGLARVRAAKRLLVSGDRKLTQIALEVGCASPSHLTSLFRRFTGMTPQAWRRDHGH
jgi:AraC-like DNA-binding protein